MKTIAIEREFGSGGREVGMKAAERAGIPFYDSTLIEEAAREFHIPIDLLKEYDEQRSGSLLYDLAMLSGYSQGMGQQKVYEFFYGIQETLKRLALRGPAIFIGRCSTEILKQSPNVICVYLYSSDIEKRVRRICETEKVSEADAKKMMEKRDKQRRAYFKYWTKKEWTDRRNYDIELNTAKLSTEECAELLLTVLERSEM